MDSKKINQLGTNVSPVLSDLTVIGNPITGQLKKITWLQVANMIGTAGTGAVLKTEVTNRTGVTLTKGTVVYINGAYNGIPTVAKAQANAEATSAQTFGLIENDIDNFANGFVVIAGKLTDANTNGIAAGSQLYLSGSTAGGFTTTKPYAPTRLVYVGIVIKESTTEGIIEVAIQNGVDLSEIHDVSAQTPANNDGIFYNSTTGLWESKSISTVYTPPVTSVFGRTGAVVAAEGDYNLTQLGDVTISSPTNGQVLKYNGTTWVNGTDSGITGSGTANQLAYFDSTSTITSSSNFTINNSTGYLIAPYIFASTELVISGTSGDNNKIYLSGTDFMIRSTFDNLRLQGGINDSNKRQVNIYNGNTLAINVETTGVVTFYNIPALATAASLFLVSDSGGLKSRTAAQVLSDIGAQGALTLTTTGTSGAATLVGNTLNIPQYQSVLTNPVTGTGSAGQVAYWTGTTTQTGSNNLFWDNSNARLGVATNSPSEKLHVNGSLYIANVGSILYFDTTGSAKSVQQYVGNDFDFFIVNNRGNTSRLKLGNDYIYLGSSYTNYFTIDLSNGSSTFSELLYGNKHFYFGMSTGADYYVRTPNVAATSTGRRGLMLSNGSNTDLKIVAGGNQTLGNWTESDKLMVIGTGYQGGGGSGETILFHSSGIGNMMALSALYSTIYTYLPIQSQNTISLMNSSSSYVDYTIPKASFNLQFYGNYWNSSTGAKQLYSGAIFGIPNSSNVSSDPSTRIVIQPGSTDTIYALSTGVVRFPQYGSNGFLKTSNSNGTITVDTNTYLTTSTAASTYLPLTGGYLTGTLYVGTTANNQAGTIILDSFEGFNTSIYLNSYGTNFAQLTTNGVGYFNVKTQGGSGLIDAFHVNIDGNILYPKNNSRVFGIAKSDSGNNNGGNLTIKAGGGVGTGTSGHLYLGSGNGGATNGSIYFGLAQSTNNNTAGLASTYVTITNLGQVRIGTTDTDGALQIKPLSANTYNASSYNGSNSNIRLTALGSGGTGITTGISFGVGGQSEFYIGAVQQSNTYADFIFQTYNGSYNERVRITNGGNVGIGISPSYKLDVSGQSRLDGYNYCSSFQFQRANSNSVSPAGGSGILVFDGGNSQMRINTSNQICFDVNNGGSPHTAFQIRQNGNVVGINSPDNTLVLALGYQGSEHGYLGGTPGFSRALLAYSVNGGYVYLKSDSTWVSASDRNRKKDFIPYSKGLAEICGLKPTYYRLKTQTDEDEMSVGLIAQEVGEVLREAYNEDVDFIGIGYNAIIVTMINAIKELKQQVDTLKK